MNAHPSAARPTDPAPEAELSVARAHLAAGRLTACRREALRLGERYPDSPAVLLLLGQVAEAGADWPEALRWAEKAVELRPRNVRARLRQLELLWRVGRVEEALIAVEDLARTARQRPGALARVGAWYADRGLHEPASACFERALQLRPEDPAVLSALADCRAALGDLTDACKEADRALFVDPERLPLRERRTRWYRDAVATGVVEEIDETDRLERVRQLGFQLDRLPSDDPRRAPICYAMGWELDALGHGEPAFGIWREGARCRLLALEALEAPDIPEAPGSLESSASDALRNGAATPREPEPASPLRSDDDANRVFLTGMPASGLSVVSRWLASAPGVELQSQTGFLAQALAQCPPGAWPDRYLEASRQLATWRQGSSSGLLTIDVDPTHLDRLDAIRMAFPRATIIHVRRDPLDHCLALFARLFPRGHAWSYDLDHLARHYGACHQLIGHWRRCLPGGVLDIDLEFLAAQPDQAASTLNGLLKEASPGPLVQAGPFPPVPPSLGIGQARAYAAQLRPVAERLKADGVPVAFGEVDLQASGFRMET